MKKQLLKVLFCLISANIMVADNKDIQILNSMIKHLSKNSNKKTKKKKKTNKNITIKAINKKNNNTNINKKQSGKISTSKATSQPKILTQDEKTLINILKYETPNLSQNAKNYINELFIQPAQKGFLIDFNEQGQYEYTQSAQSLLKILKESKNNHIKHNIAKYIKDTLHNNNDFSAEYKTIGTISDIESFKKHYDINIIKTEVPSTYKEEEYEEEVAITEEETTLSCEDDGGQEPLENEYNNQYDLEEINNKYTPPKTKIVKKTRQIEIIHPPKKISFQLRNIQSGNEKIITTEDLNLPEDHEIYTVQELENGFVAVISTNENQTIVTIFSPVNTNNYLKKKINEKIEEGYTLFANNQSKKQKSNNDGEITNTYHEKFILANKNTNIVYTFNIQDQSQQIVKKDKKIVSNKIKIKDYNFKKLSFDKLLLYAALTNQTSTIDMRYNTNTQLYNDFYKLPNTTQADLIENEKVYVFSKYNPISYLINGYNLSKSYFGYGYQGAKGISSSISNGIGYGCKATKDTVNKTYNHSKNILNDAYQNGKTAYSKTSSSISNGIGYGCKTTKNATNKTYSYGKNVLNSTYQGAKTTCTKASTNIYNNIGGITATGLFLLFTIYKITNPINTNFTKTNPIKTNIIKKTNVISAANTSNSNSLYSTLVSLCI